MPNALDGELKTSNHLLGDGGQMRSILAEDGYLYFSQILDTSPILDLRSQILEIFRSEGWLRKDSQDFDGIVGRTPTIEGEEAFFEVYDQIQRLEALHNLAHHPQLTTVMRDAVGASAFPHPLCISRLVFPENEECTTPPHQDFPNNQGTEALYASWIPLGDCPRELGGLSILEASPNLGLLPLEFSLGAGNRQAQLPEQAQQLRWLTTDFQCGDILIFGAMTVHRSLPNSSADRFRLSVDYRFQEEGQPLTATVLEPHFGRLSWEAIYADWQSDELKYYWRDKAFDIAPFDSELHTLPDSHLKEAIQLSRQYKHRRQQQEDDQE